MTPSYVLFASTLIMGTLISLSSTNWLYLWMGMELNLLSFIPIMASSQILQETEATVKYFIVQALGSGLMLMAGIMAMNSTPINWLNTVINTLFITSMIIKTGMSPCHQWLPHVMSSISWSHCLILATWQKISPMVMLIMISSQSSTSMLMVVAGLNALTGGIGGLNQAQLRTLLAYSSIGHMGWMVASLNSSLTISMLYLSTYMLITTTLMMVFMKVHLMNPRTPLSIISLNATTFLMVMLLMLSLAGIPPFLGFLPKWLIIMSLAQHNMLMLTMILMAGSLMNLFYYMNITFNFIISQYHSPWLSHTPIWISSMTFISTMSTALFIV